MAPELKQLAEKANSDAKQGLQPSPEYMKVVNGTKKRAANAVSQARVLGIIERALYGNAS